MAHIFEFLVQQIVGTTWAASATVWLSVLAAVSSVLLEPVLHMKTDDALAVSYSIMGLAIAAAIVMVLRSILMRMIDRE
ncbi:MAG: hypothetical protein EOP39_20840 [Rubrivivax sp.]|nr:MAG: hypothetical protein EOP39_20840 [Rubrivivax sp.]